MIKSDKKVKDLANILKTSDVLIVSKAIEKLRNEEPFEGAIMQLADHYTISSENSIKLLINGFFNDIKDTRAIKEVIEAIHSTKNDETRSMLITSCWQSGLDYSENIDAFIDFFMDNSFDIAFECLTVVEQSVDHIDLQKKNDIIANIKKRGPKQPAEKSALVKELINVLS